MEPQVDWQTLVVDQNWLEKLDVITSRRFGNSALAEESASYVIEKLSENNWGRLKCFKGNSSPRTFLYSTAINLVEEFSRIKFGRPRPPAWLERRGKVWVDVWKKLCLERQDKDWVIDSVSYFHDFKVHKISEIICYIKSKFPWCGVVHQEVPLSMFLRDGESASENNLEELVEYKQPLDSLSKCKYEDAALMAFSILCGNAFLNIDDVKNGSCPESVWLLDKLSDIQAAIDLRDDEYLLLKMYFVDGVKQKDIASMLGLSASKLSRQLKSLLVRIERAFVESGVSAEDVFREVKRL